MHSQIVTEGFLSSARAYLGEIYIFLYFFGLCFDFFDNLEDSGPSEIRFEVWDHDIGKDEPMGFAVFDLLKVRTPKMFRFLTLDFRFGLVCLGRAQISSLIRFWIRF